MPHGTHHTEELPFQPLPSLLPGRPCLPDPSLLPCSAPVSLLTALKCAWCLLQERQRGGDSDAFPELQSKTGKQGKHCWQAHRGERETARSYGNLLVHVCTGKLSDTNVGVFEDSVAMCDPSLRPSWSSVHFLPSPYCSRSFKGKGNGSYEG